MRDPESSSKGTPCGILRHRCTWQRVGLGCVIQHSSRYRSEATARYTNKVAKAARPPGCRGCMPPIQTRAPHLAEGALAQQHLLPARVSLDQHVLRPQRRQPGRRRVRCRPPPDIICSGIPMLVVAQRTHLEPLLEQQVLNNQLDNKLVRVSRIARKAAAAPTAAHAAT